MTQNNKTGSAAQVAGLLVIVVIVFLVATAASMVTAESVATWYREINRPSWTPPNWVFGPVWTALYVMMSVSAWLVWRQREKPKKTALVVFGAQLILNGLWSLLFFGMKNPVLGFVDIVGLWIAILITIIMFFRISKLAGWLLIPYLIWVSYASSLNLGIILLN